MSWLRVTSTGCGDTCGRRQEPGHSSPLGLIKHLNFVQWGGRIKQGHLFLLILLVRRSFCCQRWPLSPLAADASPSPAALSPPPPLAGPAAPSQPSVLSSRRLLRSTRSSSHSFTCACTAGRPHLLPTCAAVYLAHLHTPNTTPSALVRQGCRHKVPPQVVYTIAIYMSSQFCRLEG